MYLFDIGRLDGRHLTNALVHAYYMLDDRESLDLFPHSVLDGAARKLEDLLLFWILSGPDYSNNLDYFSKIGSLDSYKKQLERVKYFVYGKIGKGETLEAVRNRMLGVGLGKEAGSMYFWAYYTYIISNDDISKRYCLKWLGALPYGSCDSCDRLLDSGCSDWAILEPIVNIMTKQVQDDGSLSGSSLKAYNMYLEVIEEEFGIRLMKLQ